jgi:hypothetical protein
MEISAANANPTASSDKTMTFFIMFNSLLKQTARILPKFTHVEKSTRSLGIDLQILHQLRGGTGGFACLFQVPAILRHRT